MMGNGGNAPAWLFAFVDLAFLMLLAMTQLGGNPGPELGEIVVPHVGGDAATDLAAGSERFWQLRIHPAEAGVTPFELVAPASLHGEGLYGEDGRMVMDELRARLQDLYGQHAARPLLAPHADSRSQDLLSAVGLVEEIWPKRRRATIERIVRTP